jgi:hypothetical protein
MFTIVAKGKRDEKGRVRRLTAASSGPTARVPLAPGLSFSRGSELQN